MSIIPEKPKIWIPHRTFTFPRDKIKNTNNKFYISRKTPLKRYKVRTKTHSRSLWHPTSGRKYEFHTRRLLFQGIKKKVHGINSIYHVNHPLKDIKYELNNNLKLKHLSFDAALFSLKPYSLSQLFVLTDANHE